MAETKLLTTNDLLQLSDQGVRGELEGGVLHETMASGHRHSKIAVNLATELNNFAKPRGLGTLVASDSGVWLGRDPDLVVEIVSPSDSRRWAHDRAHMWLNHGAPLVWIVHLKTHTIDVYHPNTPTSTLHEDDSLTGHNILPGFTCPVSTIFA